MTTLSFLITSGLWQAAHCTPITSTATTSFSMDPTSDPSPPWKSIYPSVEWHFAQLAATNPSSSSSQWRKASAALSEWPELAQASSKGTSPPKGAAQSISGHSGQSGQSAAAGASPPEQLAKARAAATITNITNKYFLMFSPYNYSLLIRALDWLIS